MMLRMAWRAAGRNMGLTWRADRNSHGVKWLSPYRVFEDVTDVTSIHSGRSQSRKKKMYPVRFLSDGVQTWSALPQSVNPRRQRLAWGARRAVADAKRWDRGRSHTCYGCH